MARVERWTLAAVLVTGVDRWGALWECLQGACERNARVEGVGAGELPTGQPTAFPFEEGAFDAAISNLVFHEVRGAKDKPAVIREAVRVVRPGEAFAFEDLFFESRLYRAPWSRPSGAGVSRPSR
jgi:SAM-dependent methyltransferase